MKIIAYISEPTEPNYVDDLIEDISRVAMPNNKTLNITGLLYYTGTHFLQILEGPDHNVDDLMINILRDTRHHSLKVIFEDHISSRSLADWSLRTLNLQTTGSLRIDTLEKAVQLTSHSMKLNAEGFLFMLNDLLDSPDFLELLETQ